MSDFSFISPFVNTCRGLTFGALMRFICNETRCQCCDGASNAQNCLDLNE